uniref:Uncharacterized protein n=1 Tax=Salix viminalis TaxID=40686 RepID=A0A6N2KFX9_SALVM
MELAVHTLSVASFFSKSNIVINSSSFSAKMLSAGLDFPKLTDSMYQQNPVDVNYNYLQGANEIPLVDKNSRKQISMESTSPHLVMKRKGLMLYPIGSTSSSFGNSSPRGDIKKRSDAVLGTSKCFSREFLLMKRNSFVYTFKFSQVGISFC